jgi:putative GTP pyrophosphokinase
MTRSTSPSVVQTPEMHRAAAKSMALIEATGDYFEELMELIERNVAPARELSKQMAALYRELVGREPDATKAEGLLNDAFGNFAGDKPVEAVRALFTEKTFLLDRIRERAATKLLFRQPSITLVYLAVSKRSTDAQEAWPLTPAELKPVSSASRADIAESRAEAAQHRNDSTDATVRRAPPACDSNSCARYALIGIGF